MEDKTRLELDIQERESHRTPAAVKALVALLIIGLCAMGIFTFNMRKELLEKEGEIMLLQESFRQEKVELLSRIKMLEAGNASIKSNKD